MARNRVGQYIVSRKRISSSINMNPKINSVLKITVGIVDLIKLVSLILKIDHTHIYLKKNLYCLKACNKLLDQ